MRIMPPPIHEDVLPEGYTQLDYIQSTGTQYIDTGAVFTNGLRFMGKINLASTTTSSVKTAIFGAHNAAEPYGRSYLGVDASKNFEVGGGNGYAYYRGITISTNTDYTIDVSNIPGQGYLLVNDIDGTQTGGQAYAAPFSDRTIWLFDVNTTNSSWFTKSAMKLYYAKFYDDTGNLIRNFTPCKNPSGEVGLYDYVTKSFYGNAGGGSLPAGYTQVEYIQSTGTQYIDTGFKSNQDTRLVLDVNSPLVSGPVWLFGARTSASSKTYNFLCYGSKYRSDYNDNSSTSLTINPSGRFTIDKDKNITKINGSTASTITYGAFQCEYNLFLFSNNNAGAANSGASISIYSCKIYDNGTLIRDFVPARNSSGTLGLYDTVGGTFYTNAGSGTFTVGDEILPFIAGTTTN